MKLSDYVAEFLAKQNVQHVFGITGGAIIHVFDSIAKREDIEIICPQHEQAAAMAADAYSRLTKNIGVALATSGPGVTNLVTGVCCSYFDSIPLLVITGQVPRSQLKGNSKSRQIGFQETDTVSIFSPITKYCVMVEDPKRIRFELEKAVYMAKTGRPGPVLLDLPDDLQRENIEPSELERFEPTTSPLKEINPIEIDQTMRMLEKAQRPIIILGGGIKLAKAEEKAVALIEKLKIPAVLTWATKDMLPFDHPLVVEGFGVSSERAGNFVVQNSDLILALGTRLDTHETGSNLSTFAVHAEKIIVDIDSSELDKYEKRGMKKINLLVHGDVNKFMDLLSTRDVHVRDLAPWFKKIAEWKSKYPICPQDYFSQKENVNPYVFMKVLSEESKEGDTIIADAGSNLTWTMQGYRVKKDQNLFSAFNHSPMGYSLPAAMGAAFATKKPIICIIGDGGIQMNIQELATIKYHEIPIKIFLMNNNGYGIIQQTQDMWMESRYVASNPDSGVPVPDFVKIAQAYGIKTVVIHNHDELHDGIRMTLSHEGPILCDVKIDQHQKIIPKLSFGRSIEDLAPLLDRDEFKKNMLV